jgi:hypothetical protein
MPNQDEPTTQPVGPVEFVYRTVPEDGCRLTADYYIPGGLFPKEESELELPLSKY